MGCGNGLQLTESVHQVFTLLCLHGSYSLHHADGGIASLVQAHVAHNCKRLTVELMHYIIEARSLRKVRVGSRGPVS